MRGFGSFLFRVRVMVMESFPWLDRAVVAAIAALSAVVAAFLPGLGVAGDWVWRPWFAVGALLCGAYAARWKSAPTMVREMSGAMVATGAFGRAVALIADARFGHGVLGSGTTVVAASVWLMVALLVTWGWVRIIPTTGRADG